MSEKIISPEILAGNNVTFRIWAPEASEVTVSGDFGRGTLTKGEDGVWSVTIGPLVPDLYTYSFRVDGVKVTDPVNPGIKEGVRGSSSIFLLPGVETEFLDVKPVPYGTVSIVWYESTSLGILRNMRIYTPPGYENGNRQYPVFYLLHGAGDNDTGWSTIGRAGFIIDNLLAEKKVIPMIIVMPNGSIRNWSVPAGAAETSEMTGGFENTMMRFENDVIKDIIPYVEKNYRVLADKKNRAIAGLSMGGGQTLRITLENPDMFNYIGVFSSGARNIDGEFEKKLENLKKM